MGLCGTNVTYNGVKLINCTTREWNQTTEYDPSGVDAIYTTHRMTFEALVHAQGGVEPNVGVAKPAETAVLTMKGIRSSLLAPRARLIVTMADETILEVRPAGSASQPTSLEDVSNGPKPISVEIIHAVAGNAFRITFSIEVHVLECSPSKITQTPGVLNNRWSVAEAMDQNFTISRVIVGRLKISSPFDSVNNYRGLVTPGLEMGFRRESFVFRASEDGLTADYEITDKQIKQAAPWPATTITGTHTESTTDGFKMYSDMAIRLEAPPSVSPRELITLAVNVIEGRLKYGQEKGNAEWPSIMIHASITEHIGQRNVVDVQMKLLRNVMVDDPSATAPQNIQRQTFGNILKGQGVPLTLPNMPWYDQKYSYSPALFGYDASGKVRKAAVVMLLETYIQSPCRNRHAIGDPPAPPKQKQQKPPKDIGEPAIIEYDGSPSDNLPALYNPEIVSSPIYTKYRMESTYSNASIQVQLPIARSVNASQPDKKPTSTIFPLAAPIYRRTINVEAERVGAWPQMPDASGTYSDGGLEGTLLDHKVTLSTPSVSPDAEKRIFRILGYYTYGINRPPTEDEKISAGTMPMFLPQASDKVSREELEDKAIGPTSGFVGPVNKKDK